MTATDSGDSTLVYSHTTGPDDIVDDDTCPWCHRPMTHAAITPDGEIEWTCTNPQCNSKGG